ncbi:nucleotidyltransferase [Pseudomonas phage PspYZU05]|uniref:Thioredoxin n=1 Tax=Pseudomonas phage PspYZU05 TaxID=1983556 RepID=A0A2U7NS19_9CAUD|nr:nucleotidyltransferase [Pseudomonas phage PspYZU05]ASD52122.1 thioredoxin [Pseudomonas phage PspYZU05]
MQLVVKTVYGSHLYGLNTPESDTDYKGIFLPEPKEILLGTAKRSIVSSTGDDISRNTKDDIDSEFYSLHYFINLAIQGDTTAIDMVHTPDDKIIEYGGGGRNIWNFIRENRAKLYCSNMKAYVGYVNKQASKYGVKGSRLSTVNNLLALLCQMDPDTPIHHLQAILPIGEFSFFTTVGDYKYYEVLGRKFMMGCRVREIMNALQKISDNYGERARKAEENEGIDWKALSHAIRVCHQMREIFETGDLKYPLKNADDIKYIKSGQLPFADFKDYLDELLFTVDESCNNAVKNGMRESVDTKFWEDFVTEVYYEWISVKYKG